jgi:hypothetical protein
VLAGQAELLHPDLFEQGELVVQVEERIAARLDDLEDFEAEGVDPQPVPVLLQGSVVVPADGQHEAGQPLGHDG